MAHIITFVVVAVLGLSLLVVVAHAQAKSKDQQKTQNQTLGKEEVPKVGAARPFLIL